MNRSMPQIEMDPGFLLEQTALGPEEVRWMFIRKVMDHLKEALNGSKTFGSDIEFCIADYADAYPGFDQAKAGQFAAAAMLRTEMSVRRGEDPQFKSDLDQLCRDYAQ